MKTIVFENSQLPAIYNVLEAIKIEQGKARRGNGKLQKKLLEAEKEFHEDREELLKEYFQLNDKGNIKHDDQNELIALEGKGKQEGLDKLQELLDEEVEIDIVTLNTKLKCFYEKLDKDEFTTMQNKEINDIHFDTLMDALKEVFEKEEEK